MGIWERLQSFSASDGVSQRHGWRAPSGRGRNVSKTRGLRLEKFEDRVLLSINPSGDSENALWEQTLAREIERASDLNQYRAEDLSRSDTVQWVVGVSESSTVEQAAANVGASSLRAADFLADGYVWQFAAGVDWQEAATQLESADGIEWSYPLVPHARSSRLVPDDPLFVDQWHLQNTGQTGGLSGADANVVSVWDQFLGTGVVIGVVDDGMDHQHEDLVDRYRSDLSWDFVDGDSDPIHVDPLTEGHGTWVAGVAAASGNNALGGSGAAPDAQLAGLRLTAGGNQTDLDEAAALTYSNQEIAIYNNSWGPADNVDYLVGPGPNTLMGMLDGVTNGRGGLGSVYVFSAGNGGFSDNVNFDGFANSRFTIAVGAIDHFGQQAFYSESGAPLLVTAYSDDSMGTSITTTDWTGADGIDPGDYTDTFGGTSSSAPLVSGVIALMLEANPSLTYRDVQHVLVESAGMTDPSDSGWETNAAGYSVNHKYGFGAIDAQAAVNTARTWETVGSEVSLNSGLVSVGAMIPDASPIGISSNITMGNEVGSIEWVEVVLSTTHSYGGDLEVVLVSPSGTESVLAESHFDSTNYNQWTFTSARHWGEMSGGDWTLIVRDQYGGDVGTFDSWELNVYGQANAGSGPELIAIIPNAGDLLADGEVLDIAPRELTFRFNHGQEIDPATLDAIQIVRSGGDDVFGDTNDVAIEFGWIGIGDPVNELNEVIVRFAEPLPDDLYQITIAGTGVSPLMNIEGQVFQWNNELLSGEDLVVEFELDLGAQVVAVVPQPVVRDVSGGLIQLTDTIEVFFNKDPLDQAAAENVDFYRLFHTNETGDSTDDAQYTPISVSYDQGLNKAVLTFGADLSTYGTGAYRLRIGNDYQEISTSIEIAGSDNNSSFATAQDLGALGAGFTAESKIVSAQIEPQPYDLIWPGANDEPGHRDLPVVGTDVAAEEHIPGGDAPDTTTTVVDQSYDFADIYGTLPGGPAYNLITEQQKDRVRELFELYKTYYGVQFSEMVDDGLGGADMTIAHGDVRALDAPGGPGVVAGIAGGGGWTGTAIMDNPDFQVGSHEFGGSWFQVAMHEILHLGSLLHTYDLPPLTIMGSGEGGTFYDDEFESIFPGAHDIVHGQHMYRPDSTDIDMYEFTVDREGVFSAETVSERRADSERLDSMLTLYKFDPTDPQVPWKKVARNDDYFSDDSYLEVVVEPGRYSVAVTASGNFDFDPTISDSGIGGTTYGEYDLRLNFRPEGAEHLIDATGTRFDGDADGVPGGIYDMWFNVQTADRTLFVDKENTSGFENGTLAQPFRTIPSAFTAAESLVAAEYNPGDQPEDVPGVNVRVVGNNFDNDDASDVTTMQDNVAYEVGIGLLNNWLDDGPKLEVPHKVTLMIDAGAMFKMRGANLDSGSSAQDIDRSEGHIQVLGTPEHSVYFTSYHDELLGVDTEQLSTLPQAGDWGGVVYRNNLDYTDQERIASTDGPRRVLETEGIFLNYVNHADFRYGGGRVRVNGVTGTYTPVAMVSARPTVSFNLITESATSAISADPNSFLESKFQGNTAGDLYTADYDRVGPDIHMNQFVAHYEGESPTLPKHTNTLNGLMVGIATLAGQPTDELDVSARFDDWDLVHVISANLQINGTPGGPVIDRDTGIHMAREDARLAVDPGVVVKLDGSRIEAEMSTQLIAEGTAGYPIIFTSLMDDRYGGGGTFDTSENGTDVMPAPGDWGGLYFSPVSRGSIDNIRMFYGGGETTIEGGFAEFDPIEMRQAFVRITNSLFEFNDTGSFGDRNGRGTVTPGVIHVRGAQPVIAGNVFSNNLGPMISIDANSLIWKVMTDWGRSTGDLDAYSQYADNTGPLIRENEMWNNSTNGMIVRGVTLHTGTVWDDSDIVHVLLDEILVPNHHSFSGIRLQSNVGESLVVKLDGPEAGITASGKPQEIDDRIGGTVQIMGAPGFPVVLTSLADDTVGAGFDPWDRPMSDTNNSSATPEPGDWRSVRLEQYSNDRNVAVVNELEDAFGTTDDRNAIPESSEHLGQLAALSKAGDENLRLGFELHGSIRLDDPGDVDVYAFDATAGTKVWFDIDNTRHSLDTILELINVNGDVLASSDNSFFETNTEPTPTNLARRLDDDSWYTKDHNSTNAMDAGFNLVLPGPEGQVRTYYIRVRSAPDPGALTEPGITRGHYQLQVRLSNLQEVPGSFIKFADIRYATNGIDTAGLPIHSPLLIEMFEREARFDSDNDTFNTAEDIGNLLESDRNTIGVGGYLGSSSDVDWYKFDVDYEGIQSIGGVNDTGSRFPIVFDVDYADGMGRPDVQIAVFDSSGTLVLYSDDSNIVDDKPGPLEGADVSNLQRGTFGGYDSYIGTLHIPEGGGVSYYVAVTSQGMTPSALGQAFLRREPMETVARIAEDHIGNEFSSGIPRADNAVPLFPDMNTHADDFSLGDVVMYVSVGDDLYTVDPFTGAFETDVTGTGPLDFLPDTIPNTPLVSYGDIAMRNDGRLFTFTGMPAAQVDRNAWNGRYRELDTGDAKILKSDNDDGITTYIYSQNPPALEVWGDQPRSERGGVSFEAIAHATGNTDDTNALTGRGLLAIGNIADLRTNSNYRFEHLFTKNLLYMMSESGTARTHPGVPTTDGSRLPTDIIPLARLLTGTTLIIPEYGATDELNPFDADLRDATRFTIRDLDGDPGELVFELDCGPDIRLDPDGPMAVRDGEAFMLDTGSGPHIFEFDSGPVLVFNSFRALIDGEVFTIQDNSTQDNDPRNDNPPVTFEFEDVSVAQPDGVGNNNVAVEFTPGMNMLNLSQVVLDAINGAGFTVIATPGEIDNTEARISLQNDINLMTTPALPLGFEVQGDYGSIFPIFPADPNSNRHLIAFEEGMSESEFGAGSASLVPFPGIVNDVATAMPTLRPGFAHRTGGFIGDRLTFYNATDSAFAPNPASIDVNPPGLNNGIIIRANTPGAQFNGVDVIFTNTSGLGDAANITWVPGPGIPSLGGTLTIEVDPAATTANTLVQTINNGPAPFVAFLDHQDAILPVNDGTGFMIIDGNVGQLAGGIVGVPSFTHVNNNDGVLSGHGVDPNVSDVSIAFDADDSVMDLVQSLENAINSAILSFPNFGASGASAGNTITLNGILETGGADADGPLRVEGQGPGGFITGMAWANGTLYAVDSEGGLFEVVEPGSPNLSAWPPPNANPPIVDPPDRTIERQPATGARLRWITTLYQDEFNSESEHLGIQFEGLALGPQNVEEGRYSNSLFAVSEDGNLYGFDLSGNPEPIFLDGASTVPLRSRFGGELNGGGDFTGIDFSVIDYNLWHTTNYRRGDQGHGVNDTFTASRTAGYPVIGGTSFYFGLEDPRATTTITYQPGADNFIFTNASDFYTYDMPGGAHGSLTTDPFSLVGYDSADQPTLFFTYFLDAQNGSFQDAARVYISTDGANWNIVASNTDRDDPYVGGLNTADVSSWRQGRVSLAGYAGEENIKIRFDFNTASNLNVGDQYGARATSGADTTGAYLRAVPGTEIADGDTFEVDVLDEFNDAMRGDVFEFDMGVGLYIPNVAGLAIPDGESFTITDASGTSQAFEFQNSDVNWNPGLLNLNAIPISIVGNFTTSDVAVQITNAINNAGLVGVDAHIFENRVMIHGALAVTQSLGATIVSEGNGFGQVETGMGILLPRDASLNIPDGARFTITDDFGVTRSFEFENPDDVNWNPGLSDHLAQWIYIDSFYSNDDVALAVSTSINNSFLAFNGANAFANGDRVLVQNVQDITLDPGTNLVLEGSGTGPVSPWNIPVFVRQDMTSEEVAVAVAESLDQFYSNSRIFRAFDGGQTVDGQTFTLNDGYQTVTFEFNNTGVNPAFNGNNVEVPFNTINPDADVVQSIINAVNSANTSLGLRITASGDPTDTSLVLLTGAWVISDFGTSGLMPFGTVDTPGEFTSSKVDGDLIHMIGHGIPSGLSGPLAYSNFLPGDYRHQLPQFGDSQFFSNARGQNDKNEGFYIDDLVVGFTERGELVTDATSQTAFSARSPGTAVTEGYYQLEIRRGDEDGIWPDPPTPPTLNLDPLYYDTNDRMRDGITLFAPEVLDINHLDTFDISDGKRVVTFQFVGGNIGGGNPNFVPIEYFGWETAGDIGSEMADVINEVAFDGLLNVTASSIETSERVDLNGAYWATAVDGVAPMVWGNLGDENLLFRDQGQTIIESSRITHSEEWGIRVDAADPDGTSDSRHPGAPAPLRQINTQGLVPGIILQNNVTAFGGSGGIYIGGDPINQPAAAAPFVKVVNNTIYGNNDASLSGLVVSDGDDNGSTDLLFLDPSSSFASQVVATVNFPVADVAANGAGDIYLVSSETAPALYIAQGDVFAGSLVVTQVGPLVTAAGTSRELQGLAFSPSGILYGLGTSFNSTADALFEIDTTTGQITEIISLVNSTNGTLYADAAKDIAFTTNGSMYVSVGTDLLLVDPLAQSVFSVGNMGVSMDGLAFLGSSLYGVEASGQVYDIGLFSATATNLGLLFSPSFTPSAGGATSVFSGGNIGIQVGPNASPTLLNNIVASMRVGVQVDSSSSSTVLGSTVFQDNDQNTSGTGLGNFSMILPSGDPLFVNPQTGNFYPDVGSQIIDSSVDNLEDRPALTAVRDPLGIPESPILAPVVDLFGQVRTDDPNVSPPPGVGFNVYKDRGAIDRVDFAGPTSQLIEPLDNDAMGLDRNPARYDVFIAGERLTQFAIQLFDEQGVGVDDLSVVSPNVEVWRDDTLLSDGLDYFFEYNSTNDVIYLIPAPGVWLPGHVYSLVLNNQGIRDDANNALQPNRTDGSTVFNISLAGLDYGDAPDPTYPTFFETDGARHVITGGYLGSGVTSEPDARQNSDATGDTLDDGVRFDSALLIGTSVGVTISASQPGKLDAWIDFNDDGDWLDFGEKIFNSIDLSAGDNLFNISTPAGLTEGEVFGRFRYSQDGNLTTMGEATDGEVEDYQIRMVEFFEDFGDAPDQYRTTIGRNGPRHVISGLYLGTQIDNEPDGQPNLAGTGDDDDGNDDDDGVEFLGPLVPGTDVDVTVTVSQAGGVFQGWIDFNADGDFNDVSEQIFTDVSLPIAGVNSLSVSVPDTVTEGNTFARFRISTETGLLSFGSAQNGEVEDYRVTIIEAPEDYGDAPDPTYPTLVENNGARHSVEPGFHLGPRVDFEFSPVPSIDATGDDIDNFDDEDGVRFSGSLMSGEDVTLTITASDIGYLNAWIDYNANGNWLDPGEQIFTDELLQAGDNVYALSVPRDIVSGDTFARFRFSHEMGLLPTTPENQAVAPDGEVEDYMITMTAGNGAIRGRKFDDLNANGQFDFGETGMANVTVYLDQNDNEILDPTEPMTVSAVDDLSTPFIDETGYYEFDGLFDDVYIVREIVPAEWVQTAPLVENPVGGFSSGVLKAIQSVDGTQLNDGNTFTVSDGAVTARFEFENMLFNNGVNPSNIAFPFNMSDTADQVAVALGNAINTAAASTGMQVTATVRSDVVILKGATVLFDPESSVLSGATSHSNTDGSFTIVLDPSAVVTDVNFANFKTPHISVSDVSVAEGDVPGETIVTIELNLTESFGAEVEVSYNTQDGDPTQGPAATVLNNDYEPVIDTFLFTPQGVPTSAWGTTVLTDNLPNDYDYHVSGNRVAWEGFDGNDWEIYLAIVDEDGTAEIRQLTDNDTHDEKPFVFGTGVVWSGVPDVGGGANPMDDDFEIYRYEADTATTTRLTNNLLDDMEPQLSDSHVAWWAQSGLDSDVFLYDLSTGGYPKNISNNSTNDYDPRLSGGVVAWSGIDPTTSIAPDREIFVYDAFATVPQVVQITQNTDPDLYPEIDGTNIVWQGGSQTDTDIFLYQMDALSPTVVNLTSSGTTPSRNQNPHVSGENIVWQGWDDSSYYTSDANWEIYHQNVNASTFANISNNLSNDDQNPRIADNHVVWSSHNEIDRDWDVYHVDLTSQNPANISMSTDREWKPQISITGQGLDAEPFVGWRGFDGTDYEIVVAQPNTPTVTQTVTLIINGDQFFEADETFFFDVSGASISVAGTNTGIPVTVDDGRAIIEILNDDGALDFGDAPEQSTLYPTTLANNGARHLVSGSLYLGSLIDADSNGRPQTDALGDDIYISDDEDGVLFGDLAPGSTAAITVTASQAGRLDAWFDFNADGDWDDLGEQIFDDHQVFTGSNTLNIDIPAYAPSGQASYARFRLSTNGVASYIGSAADGEVEDYLIEFSDSVLPVIPFDEDLLTGTITVHGTDDVNDSFAVTAGQLYTVDLNGYQKQYNLDEFDHVVFDGGTDIDSASIVGTVADDTITLNAGSAEFIGGGLTINLSQTENITVNGGGGDDWAQFNDSAGDDNLVMTPHNATMTGPGFQNVVEDVDNIVAFAPNGGTDSADFTGSESIVEEFYVDASLGMARMNTSEYSLRAMDFEDVSGHGTGSRDYARLYDSDGDDLFEAWPDHSVLSGPGYIVQTDSFAEVHAYAPTRASGGIDEARLYGSTGNDKFTGSDIYSKLESQPGNPTEFLLRSKSFEQVYSDASDGSDEVKLFDSLANDHLEAQDTWVQVNNIPDGSLDYNFLFRIANVESGRASANQGGNNTKNSTVDWLMFYDEWAD